MGGFSGINVDVGSGASRGMPWQNPGRRKPQQPITGPIRPETAPAGTTMPGSFASPADGGATPGPLTPQNVPGYSNVNTGTKNAFADLAGQDQANQNKALNSTTPVLKEAMSNANPAAVEASPFYRALKNQAIESTSASYDNERANSRARANASGFGYASPVAAGAENEIGAREAGALARAPEQALLETPGFIAQTEAPGLAAARTTTAQGGQYGQEASQLFGDQLSWQEQQKAIDAQRMMHKTDLQFELYKQWLQGAQSGAAGAAGG
ncbi:MAG TPA: hypothetical protein VGR03_01955 [Candidatus Acidoferrum sp.]|nr:hypothetical protein [Candidatus Acidoferrum sp.]